jgi:thiol-disulfide isomerase/thioredoxin
MSDEAVQSIDTQEALEALMSPDGPAAIIDFWAGWCGPCKDHGPAVRGRRRRARRLPRSNFLKLDTERHPELAAAFKVRSLPTLLLGPPRRHQGRPDRLPQSAATIRKKAQWLLDKAEGRGLWNRLFG